jgi:hypothetical protein
VFAAIGGDFPRLDTPIVDSHLMLSATISTLQDSPPRSGSTGPVEGL